MSTEDYGLELAKAAAEGAGKESVNKLAEVIGGIFPFFGTKRQAVATYVSDIQSSDLPPEAKMMAIANAKKTYKQMQNQCAIAKIAQDAAQEGTDFSPSSNVDDEWLERFMDSAKFVSDEEVQVLWGNLLAKEFETPNSTPASVIRILSEITPLYAKAFQVLCSLSVKTIRVGMNGQLFPPEAYIILPPQYTYLKGNGITFSVLNELQMLGLIQFDPTAGYILEFDSSEYPKLHLQYAQKSATVLKYANMKFPVGNVILTQAGNSLSRFTERTNIEGHFEAVVDYLTKKKVEFSDQPEIRILEQ